VVATALMIMWVFFLVASPRATASVIVVVSVAVVLGVFTYMLVKICIEESKTLVVKVRVFVQDNPNFQALLEDFGKSSIYTTLESKANAWGIPIGPFDPERVKGAISDWAIKFSDYFRAVLLGMLSVITDAFGVVVSFTTFLSSLYLFLSYQNKLSNFLGNISPFGAEHNERLLNSLYNSITSVFACSISIGLTHGVGTYLVFKFAGIDLCIMLSCLAGFAAMLPIFSSWVVWVPTAIGLLFTGSTFGAIVIICVELLLDFGDRVIYDIVVSAIEGRSRKGSKSSRRASQEDFALEEEARYTSGVDSALISYFIAMGLYAFGVLGLVLGPLLASLLITVVDMYTTFSKKTQQIDMRQTSEEASPSRTPKVLDLPTPGLGANPQNNLRSPPIPLSHTRSKSEAALRGVRPRPASSHYDYFVEKFTELMDALGASLAPSHGASH